MTPVVTEETAPLTEEAPATEEAAALPEDLAPVSGEPAPATEEGPATEEPAEPAHVNDEPGATNETEVSDSSGRTAAAEEPVTLLAAEQITLAIAGDTVDQCNDVGTVGGDTITCTVTITNNCTYNAATPETPTCETTVVTEISCTGSAMCPTGTTQILTEPITVITQCNNAGTGGASTITCTVTVTNNLYGYPTGSVIDSTVVQCQDPGAVDTLTCVATPDGNNQIGDGGPGGQTVNQCNSSGGEGGTMTCTVTAPPSQSTGLPTTITQCNESGTTGASTVTCTATITNNFFDSIPGGDNGGGDNGGGPGDGGPGDGGPGDGGPGDGGPGDGGPGDGGPGDGGPGDGGPGDGGPGDGGPGGGGPGGGGPGDGGPGGGGPGGPLLVGTGGPPTDGAGSPPGESAPRGASGDSARDGGPGTRSTAALPYSGLDIGIAALFGLLALLLGIGLSLLVSSNRRGDGAGEGPGRPPTAA